LDSVKKGF